MPVQVMWGNTEHTILHYQFSDPWTWEDFYSIMQQGKALREAAGLSEVDAVIDMSQVRTLPSGAMTHIRGADRSGVNARHLVLVQAGALMRALLTTISRVSPRLANKVKLANSMEEAYALLEAAPSLLHEPPTI